MLPQLFFFTSVAFGFVTWGIVATLYIWPALRRLPRVEALRRMLILHSFRFVGLAFLVPGVVSSNLPAGFANPTGYGDAIAAILALLSLLLLNTRSGPIAVWVFNIWGTADLLDAFFQGNHAGLQAGQLGAAFFIPTFIVPLLLITHGIVFRLLLQPVGAAAVQDRPRPASP